MAVMGDAVSEGWMIGLREIDFCEMPCAVLVGAGIAGAEMRGLNRDFLYKTGTPVYGDILLKTVTSAVERHYDNSQSE